MQSQLDTQRLLASLLLPWHPFIHLLTIHVSEGVLTCVLAVAAYLYLPHSAAQPRTILGRRAVSLFSPRQGSVVVTRVMRDDPTKALRYGRPVLPRHIVETFADWRLYGHLVAALLSMVVITPVNTYAPSIIKSLGFDELHANGLNSVGSVCALIWSVGLAYSSDRFRERGFHVAVAYLWGAIGTLWLAFAPDSAGPRVLYGTSSYFRGGLYLTACNTDNPGCRGRCLDANGHGLRSGHQCRLALVQDGGPQTARRSRCVRHEPAAGQLSREPALQGQRYAIPIPRPRECAPPISVLYPTDDFYFPQTPPGTRTASSWRPCALLSPPWWCWPGRPCITCLTRMTGCGRRMRRGTVQIRSPRGGRACMC